MPATTRATRTRTIPTTTITKIIIHLGMILVIKRLRENYLKPYERVNLNYDKRQQIVELGGVTSTAAGVAALQQGTTTTTTTAATGASFLPSGTTTTSIQQQQQ